MPSRPLVLATSLAAILGAAPALAADWLVLRDGSKSPVAALRIETSAVRTVTLRGEPWSVWIELVDVAATRAANGLGPDETDAPGWRERFGVPAPAGPPAPAPEAPAVVSPPPHPPVAPRRPTAPISQGPPPPALRAAPVRSPLSRPRLALFVHGAVRPGAIEFGETIRFDLFRETASIATAHRDGPQRGLELGATVYLWRRLGLLAAVERSRGAGEARFEAFLPHPLVFGRLRRVEGRRGGLGYEEDALHVGAVLAQSFGDRLLVDVFAGPSLFRAETSVLVDVLYAEAFPFDAVIPLGTAARRVGATRLGWNVGAAATLRLVGPLGASLGVRLSRARIELRPADGRRLELDAGGLRAAAGLRLLFP